MFRINTAHWMRVLGGSSAGTTSSVSVMRSGTASCVFCVDLGAGGGAANSIGKERIKSQRDDISSSFMLLTF